MLYGNDYLMIQFNGLIWDYNSGFTKYNKIATMNPLVFKIVFA